MRQPLRLAIVAGEASGDMLGASLLGALAARGVAVEAMGVGGPALTEAGLATLFPQSEIAVMGFGPVIRRLPLLIRRIRETAEAIVAARPDALVTIDAPDFSKRVARRVRKASPDIPTLHWVCPSVWAWRPGRAPAMRPYIDHILCLLPFEPEALHRLGGPEGHYVGHPLVERIAEMRPAGAAEAARRAGGEAPLVLLLPGSRMAEIRRKLPLFLDAARIAGAGNGARFVLPTLPHLLASVRAMAAAGGLPVEIVTGEAAKYAAFRAARAALAASGTVTLELALAGIPTIAAYRVAGWEAAIARRLVTVPSVILPNIILGEKAVPEFLQEEAVPERLGPALRALLPDGPARNVQLAAFERLEARLRAGGEAPSARAASLLLDVVAKARDTGAR
ncbi:MAG: lipid-A-disaccharide synthase [Rhabdaerophilum calidifontis]